MPNNDPRGRIVYPIHKLMIDSYNLLNTQTLKTGFLINWLKCLFFYFFYFQANGLACMGQYKEGEFKSAAAADSLFVAKHAY